MKKTYLKLYNFVRTFISSKFLNLLLVLGSFIGKFQNSNNFFYFSELNKNPVEGFSAGLIDDNDIFKWEVLIIGPPDTL